MRGFWVVVLLALLSLGADWPQYQGPGHDGISSEKGLAKLWPSEGPRVDWTVKVGEGFAGPAVAGGEVFLLDREEDERDVMRCIDLKTGQEKWRRSFDAPGRLSYNGSRSTPAVTEKFVYAVGPFGDVYAVDRKTGKAVWTVSLQKDYNSKPPGFGYGQSPLVYEDKLIVAPMSGGEGLTALDRKTGDEIWSTPGIGGNAYTTAMPVTIDGVKQITFLTDQQWTSVEPGTGKLLWRFTGYRERLPIPNPTVLGSGKFFITGGYKAGSMFVKVSHVSGKWQVKQVGKAIDIGSQIHPALLHEGFLYVNINENGKMNRGLACLDMQGNVLWQTHNAPSVDRGGIMIGGGMLISLGGEDGVLRLIELSPERYRELASAQMFSNLRKRKNNLWSPLALSDGKLIIRSQFEMKCVDLLK